MTLIDRYIHEVGRYLPRQNRSDIQVELRSSLVDALDDRFGADPTEDEISEFLVEFGPPKTVAASYYPKGQYLIGPELFPLFRMVVGIALAAVLGAQLLAWGVATFIAHETISLLEMIAGLVNSIPMSFGWVVLVFAILQRFDVRPDMEDEPWEPESLPQISDEEPVKRGERIFGIVVASVILALLFIFRHRIGFWVFPGGQFFANPVISKYIGWISLSLLVGIGLDVYLLWQGRWSLASRGLKIAANVLSIVVLYLLVQGHTAWLVAHGAGGFFDAIEGLAGSINDGMQLFGMYAFRLAFGVALIVTSIDTLVMLFRMIKASLPGGYSPDAVPNGKA